MAAIESTNQTQFSAEQPFFEQPIGLPQEERVVKPVVPFFKRRKTIILIITTITVILLLILFVINLIVERNRRLGKPSDVIIATPTPVTANNLQLEVEQLKQEWKAADPTQLELQPPAIDYAIRLDPTVR
jgi:hypothetical protein